MIWFSIKSSVPENLLILFDALAKVFSEYVLILWFWSVILVGRVKIRGGEEARK